MNINRISATNAAGIYKKSQVQRQKVNDKTTLKDDVVLSESGKIFKSALKVVQGTPDIREEKINEITSKIKTGEYKVKKEDLVNKMITNAFFVR